MRSVVRLEQAWRCAAFAVIWTALMPTGTGCGGSPHESDVWFELTGVPAGACAMESDDGVDGSVDGTETYTYTAGRLDSADHSSWDVPDRSFRYDEDGRLSAIEQVEGSVTSRAAFSYEDGFVTTVEWHLDGVDADSRYHLHYDEDGRLSRVDWDNGAGDTLEGAFSFVHQAAVGIVERHVDYRVDGDIDARERYIYGEDGRIESVEYDYQADGITDRLATYRYESGDCLEPSTSQSPPIDRARATNAAGKTTDGEDASGGGDPSPTEEPESHFLKIRLRDRQGNPMPYLAYELSIGEDTERHGRTDSQGMVLELDIPTTRGVSIRLEGGGRITFGE